ncbi:FtsH/Yme1/Tma family ATP-dependent metallopeptidase [Neoroseomonas soli]|uniref:Peptidase M41 domain-containing protein n=1 Tax=Neoroseomonas soli TaxID=1081025 RepID=A0A9X9WX48_9PROT|nr:hypothetical protein [Neoroseomonas soli]MBR0671727.1 hypothetical protein [Neoroseomonas soli]
MTDRAVAVAPVRRIVALPPAFPGKPLAYVRVPQKAVAAHEAGHAAVAVMLGAPIKYITFRSGRGAAGHAVWHEPPEWFVPGKGRALTPHGALMLGLITAAGPLAERIDDITRATKLNAALDQHEMSLAFGYLNAAVAASIAPNASKVPDMERIAPVVRFAAAQVLHAMLGSAHRERQAVADRLTTRGRLLAHEVMPLLQGLPRYSSSDIVDAMRTAGMPTMNRLPVDPPPWWGEAAASIPDRIP